MMNVCTHAGLRSSENKLLTPAKALAIDEPLMGLGLREFNEEGGESGGAGSRDSDRVLREPIRPDSSIYGVREERLRPILRASSSFSSISISTSFISSETPWAG